MLRNNPQAIEEKLESKQKESNLEWRAVVLLCKLWNRHAKEMQSTARRDKLPFGFVSKNSSLKRSFESSWQRCCESSEAAMLRKSKLGFSSLHIEMLLLSLPVPQKDQRNVAEVFRGALFFMAANCQSNTCAEASWTGRPVQHQVDDGCARCIREFAALSLQALEDAMV